VVVGRVRGRCHVLLRQSLALLRHKPSNGHVRDVEALGDLDQRLTSSSTTECLSTLVWRSHNDYLQLSLWLELRMIRLVVRSSLRLI